GAQAVLGLGLVVLAEEPAVGAGDRAALMDRSLEVEVGLLVELPPEAPGREVGSPWTAAGARAAGRPRAGAGRGRAGRPRRGRTAGSGRRGTAGAGRRRPAAAAGAAGARGHRVAGAAVGAAVGEGELVEPERGTSREGG